MSGRSADGTDLLQVLVFSKVLASDQVEAIRRTAKAKGTSVEQTICDLGIATEVQIAEALARYSGLRFVKINPLDLDLDVVTTALSGPFARRHGLIAISKSDTTLTVAVHNPLAPFPVDDIRSVTGLEVERVEYFEKTHETEEWLARTDCTGETAQRVRELLAPLSEDGGRTWRDTKLILKARKSQK